MVRVDARPYSPVMAEMNPLPRTLTEAVNYFAFPENCLSYLVARPRAVGAASLDSHAYLTT
jgi:hypothetical protein